MPARRLAIICAAAATALVASAAPAGAQPPLPGERIAAGVTAAGTDLAGLTADEAAARLNEVHGARLENGLVTVQAADITWTFKTVDAVVQFDELQSAKRALYAGRDARGAPVDVPLVVSFTKAAVAKFAAQDRQAPAPPGARRSAEDLPAQGARHALQARARHQPARARRRHRGNAHGPATSRGS